MDTQMAKRRKGNLLSQDLRIICLMTEVPNTSITIIHFKVLLASTPYRREGKKEAERKAEGDNFALAKLTIVLLTLVGKLL